MKRNIVLTQADIKRLIHDRKFEDWKVHRYNAFRSNVLDDEFPCFFATESERKGTARYLFIEHNDEDDMNLMKLREGLLEYLKSYKNIGKRTTLAVFFEPCSTKMLSEEYKKQFWNVIHYLHDNDPEPWPATIPSDVNNPNWVFCFGGEPIFIVARSPIYLARKSRYSSLGLEITIQPRKVLEDITGDTKAGKRAREIIRKKLIQYDEILPHPDIEDYGNSDSRGWKQYILPETNEESVVRCPFIGEYPR